MPHATPHKKNKLSLQAGSAFSSFISTVTVWSDCTLPLWFTCACTWMYMFAYKRHAGRLKENYFTWIISMVNILEMLGECWFVWMHCSQKGILISWGGQPIAGLGGGQGDTGAGALVLHAEQKHQICVSACVCVCKLLPCSQRTVQNFKGIQIIFH